jgi:hypothetical protein
MMSRIRFAVMKLARATPVCLSVVARCSRPRVLSTLKNPRAANCVGIGGEKIESSQSANGERTYKIK